MTYSFTPVLLTLRYDVHFHTLFVILILTGGTIVNAGIEKFRILLEAMCTLLLYAHSKATHPELISMSFTGIRIMVISKLQLVAAKR